MYVSPNFTSKKALKEAIKEGKEVTVFAPGLGNPPLNGTCSVEGPHYPKPHRWYAKVTIEKGRVIKVV
jgi:hypothetical protein